MMSKYSYALAASNFDFAVIGRWSLHVQQKGEDRCLRVIFF